MNLQLSHLLAPESVQKAPELAELFTEQDRAVEKVFGVVDEFGSALDTDWSEKAEREMMAAGARGESVTDLVAVARVRRAQGLGELAQAERELKKTADAVRVAVREWLPSHLDEFEERSKAGEDALLAAASSLQLAFDEWAAELSCEQWATAGMAAARPGNVPDYTGTAINASGGRVGSRALAELGEAIFTAVRRGNAGTRRIAGDATAVVVGNSGVEFTTSVATAVALASDER